MKNEKTILDLILKNTDIDDIGISDRLNLDVFYVGKVCKKLVEKGLIRITTKLEEN